MSHTTNALKAIWVLFSLLNFFAPHSANATDLYSIVGPPECDVRKYDGQKWVPANACSFTGNDLEIQDHKGNSGYSIFRVEDAWYFAKTSCFRNKTRPEENDPYVMNNGKPMARWEVTGSSNFGITQSASDGNPSSRNLDISVGIGYFLGGQKFELLATLTGGAQNSNGATTSNIGMAFGPAFNFGSTQILDTYFAQFLVGDQFYFSGPLSPADSGVPNYSQISMYLNFGKRFEITPSVSYKPSIGLSRSFGVHKLVDLGEGDIETFEIKPVTNWIITPIQFSFIF